MTLRIGRIDCREVQKEAPLSGLPAKIANAFIKNRTLLLAGTVVAAIALPQIGSAFDQPSGERRMMLAEVVDPKKKKEEPKAQPKPQPKPVPKAVEQPKPQPKPVPKAVEQPKPQPKPVPKAVEQPKPQPKPVPKAVEQPKPPTKPVPKAVEQPKPPTKPVPKAVEQPQPKLAPKAVEQPQPKLAPKAVEQPQPKPAPKAVEQPQPKLEPKQIGKQPDPKFAPKQAVQPKGPEVPPAGVQTFGQPKAAPGKQFGNVDEIKGKRKETRNKSGQVFIVEPGNRRIFRDGKRAVILRDDGARMRRWGNARFEVRGTERYTTVRRGGYEVITITDANGRLLRRFRRGPDGREHVLIDNRRRGGRGVAIGVGAAAVGIVALGLMAPRITIPRDRYIVDAGSAPPVMLYETLEAPPVEPLERAYTLDEIRDNVELRDRMRSVDINTINFATGSWEVSPEQIPQLQALAEAMLKIIGDNPDTVFLLEGHTDTVGNPEDNLSLSDRRAESVAEILTSNFNVPPENLTTQGFGEQNLRVQVEGPSRENRRVQVRNITALLTGGGGPGGGQPGGDGPPGQPPG
jgi:outer membrane protein OmpA-like peptidoglycan-associated protein